MTTIVMNGELSNDLKSKRFPSIEEINKWSRTREKVFGDYYRNNIILIIPRSKTCENDFEYEVIYTEINERRLY